MSASNLPTHREISAATFQAVGPCRIAVLTLLALRGGDLDDPARRAVADGAVARIETALKMLEEGYTAQLAMIDMEEPDKIATARAAALDVMKQVKTALIGANTPCAEDMVDPEGFRALCIDRVDPVVTKFLQTMIATMEGEQSRLDDRKRGVALQAVGQARSVGRSIQMVALNAAIEAAGAGNEGRGFMVIAEEVKNLADRTQTILQDVAEALRH